MANKDFGVKKINLTGASGTPTISSPNNLNLNATTVAISTDVSVGGEVVSDVIVSSPYSVGIGSTIPTTKLDVSGDSKFSGVINADGLVVTGVATFQTNIGGTLNPDRLVVSGVSTFQDHINLGNNDKIKLGGSDDLQIYNDGFDSYIVDDGVGDLHIRGTSAIKFENAVGSETYANFNVDAATELYYDNVKKFETTSDGVKIGEIGISAVGVITGPSELIIDPAGVGDNTGSVRIKGDLFVDGEQFIVDSSRIELADFNVGIASTVSSNSLLDGAGIGIGDTSIRKTLTFNESSDSLKSSENFDIADGKSYKINGTNVLTSVQLTIPNLSVSGIGTIETLDVTSGTIDTLNSTSLNATNLVVSGLSTFTGIGTFENDLYVGGQLHAPSLNVQGGVSLGQDLSTRNLTASGFSEFTGIATFNGGIDGDLNALGKTYYVATTGNNSDSGDNINQPFLTIAQALSVATNGDIINVSAGIYEETCPLTIPRGVTVKGAGLRATTIRPTTATQQENIFLLNDISTVEDFTIRGSYYDSTADTGYAFSYATGIAITTRSPYIQRITVLNTGSSVTADDPYGYDTADSPPTSYIAGRGALVDGSKVTSDSLEAGMLFNEVTFFTPNNRGTVLTNGARAEYLNCFHYFASQAIVGLAGTVGIAGTADARLKFTNPGVTPSVDDVVKLREGGTVVAVGTITEYNSPYAKIDGPGFGKFVVAGAGTTQDLNFYQSDGTTHTGIASAIALADYTMFGAEMRSVGCAVEYGSQGVVADGNGVKLRLFATNFNHVGSGKDMTNDATLTIQANEVVETNDGQVSYVSIDQAGDFRVGDAFFVSQETGNVSFAATTYNLETTGELTVTDGGSNESVITPTSLTVGNIQIAANTLSSTSGDINIDPAGANETNVTGNLNVTGILTASVLQVASVQKGDTSIAIDDTGSDGTIRMITDSSEGLRVTNDQKVGINSSSPAYRLDVQGDINTSTDVKINGTSVLTSASDEAIALAIALG